MQYNEEISVSATFDKLCFIERSWLPPNHAYYRALDPAVILEACGTASEPGEDMFDVGEITLGIHFKNLEVVYEDAEALAMKMGVDIRNQDAMDEFILDLQEQYSSEVDSYRYFMRHEEYDHAIKCSLREILDIFGGVTMTDEYGEFVDLPPDDADMFINDAQTILFGGYMDPDDEMLGIRYISYGRRDVVRGFLT